MSETIRRARVPRAQATGELERVRTLRELCGKGFALYSGEDGNAAEFTLQGGDGVISVTSNVAPSTQAKVFAAALNGERESVARLNEPLVSLHQRLFLQANPIPVKWALAAQRRMESGDTDPPVGFVPRLRDPLLAWLLSPLAIDHDYLTPGTIRPVQASASR